jgi:hypothetical protein
VNSVSISFVEMTQCSSPATFWSGWQTGLSKVAGHWWQIVAYFPPQKKMFNFF